MIPLHDDLARLSDAEQEALLVHLLRTVALKRGHEVVRQALVAAFYPTPNQTNAAVPDWLQPMTEPEEPTAEDYTAAEEYLKAVRNRLQAKYGTPS